VTSCDELTLRHVRTLSFVAVSAVVIAWASACGTSSPSSDAGLHLRDPSQLARSVSGWYRRAEEETPEDDDYGQIVRINCRRASWSWVSDYWGDLGTSDWDVDQAVFAPYDCEVHHKRATVIEPIGVALDGSHWVTLRECHDWPPPVHHVSPSSRPDCLSRFA
jgi:hypothetical protein